VLDYSRLACQESAQVFQGARVGVRLVEESEAMP
jgi:hypothetical protein